MRGRDNRWSRGNRDGNRLGGPIRGGLGRGVSRGGHKGRGFGSRDRIRSSSNNEWQSRPKTQSPGLRLTEDQIGVTQYMSEHEGFHGIIKSRYSDFQVSEINLQGEVAQLTTLTPPEQPAEDPVKEDEELLLTKYNVDILPMDTWDQINKVAVGTVDEPIQIDVTKSTKEERTKIHEAVKKAFGETIVGSTVTIDDNKYVKFEKFKKGVRIDTRVKWTWPGEFVHFIVHKENCDTMDAAVKIAERLRSHIRPSMLGYAGTKDRRAKTSQWFSVRKTDPRRLATACRDLRELKIGNYSFRDHHLKLGMLKGNKFRIALRNVSADDAVIEAACSRLRDNGFINYYGLQRFGTRVEVPTYDVGMKLLKGNFQEAIDSILREREGPLQAALAEYARRGAAAAAAVVPRRLHSALEARLLQALADKPNDLHNALQRVPRNTRLLYLHAYQSLVWNRCVSERIQRLGLAPRAGDLVPLRPEQIIEDTDDEESDSEESPEKSEEAPEDPEENSEKPPVTDKVSEGDKKSKQKNQEREKVPVKVLTQEDVDSNSYTIFDVVMPLPGYFIEYPPNMKDYYETLLTNDGLTLELKHKIKSYCMSGAYRHVAVKPSDVSWRCQRYSDPYCDLLLSDADLLAGKRTNGLVDDGIFRALLLTLSLPSSCYATMALRELLRADTSAPAQAALDSHHKRKAAEEPALAEHEKRGKDE